MNSKVYGNVSNSTLVAYSNISNNDTDYKEPLIGGLAYFLIYLSDYLPYVVLNSFGTIMGIFGTHLIILLVFIHILSIIKFNF